MKKIVFIWTIIIWANAFAEAGKRFTTETGKHVYIEIERKFNWFEAIVQCTRLNMSLISMDSPNKTRELYNLIKTNFDITSNKDLWTGGNDQEISRHFEWISTGEAFAYTNWRPSEPDSATQRCVVMNTVSSLEWFDWNCDSKFGFACEENSLQKVTNLLNEKTEEFDSLKKEFEEFKKTHELQTNLKLACEELKILYRQGLEDMQQKQEEFAIIQKSSDQQNKNEFNALKAQISNYAGIKQILIDIQTNQLQNKNQIFDIFTKIDEINKSEAIKSTGNTEITNPICCAGLLTVKSEELEDLKQTNKMLINQLFGVLQKSYELNTNRTTLNKNYNFFERFNKN